MALPAFGILPYLLAAIENLLRGWRRLSHVRGLTRRPLREEAVSLRRIRAVNCQLVLDVLDDREASGQRQLIPSGHRRTAHATRNRPQQIAVGRHRLLGQPE